MLKTLGGKSIEMETNRENVHFSYSTSEKWTGDYWIDGSKIYTKTISIGSLMGANQKKELSHGIKDFRFLLDIKAFAISNLQYYRVFPGLLLDIYILKDKLIVATGSTALESYYQSYAVLYYCKNEA